VNWWRSIDRLSPNTPVSAAVAAHIARWLIMVAVAVACAMLFGQLDSGPLAGAGAILTNTLVLAVCGLTLAFFRPSLYRSLRTVGVIAAVFVTVLTAAAVAARGASPTPEFVPVALAGVLFSVLFDSRVSVFASLVLAALIGLQPPYLGTPALFLFVVVGVASSFSVRVIRRRDQVFYSILVTAAAYALAEVAMGLSAGTPISAIGRSIVWGTANSVVSVALALMFLPPLEEFAGVDTYLKLLEWSDLNRPLMRRLSIEAPGTFAHTMRIAHLSEAACTAIGANGLLARVGSYYHDIGKLVKPEFFVENQPRGRNAHDKLTPTASAAIIRNHVAQGLELANEYHLPAAIRAFITEHHGTGRITYFYEKARESEGNAVNPGDFSYPGPVPQSAETAICMLADGVEASAHVLNDPTPQKICEVISHIVRHRIEQGQLREAPLTLKQLEVVKDEFARVLIGMYHHRIDYPVASGGITAEFASSAPA
jgi:putative nucleotidyltransferase with HDIG domain